MTEPGATLEIRTSPHILSGHSVDVIMFNVVLALAPVTAFAVYAFGLAALLVLGVAVASCLLTEWAVCRLSGRPGANVANRRVVSEFPGAGPGVSGQALLVVERRTEGRRADPPDSRAERDGLRRVLHALAYRSGHGVSRRRVVRTDECLRG